MKEKLKPTRIIVPWTTRELKQLLKGLKENIMRSNWLKGAGAKIKDKTIQQIVTKLFLLNTKEPKNSLSLVEKEIVALYRRHGAMRYNH